MVREVRITRDELRGGSLILLQIMRNVFGLPRVDMTNLWLVLLEITTSEIGNKSPGDRSSQLIHRTSDGR